MGEAAQIRNRRLGCSAALCAALLLAWLGGCGDGKVGDTPYGSAAQVREYRLRIDPIIDQINAIEQEAQRTAVGASGQATAENLAAVYQQVLPRLQEALAAFAQLVPPPRLQELHRDMRQIITLRLGAYGAVLEGWEAQQAQGQTPHSDALYQQAEDQLRQANALIALVNQELRQVDLALGQAEGGNPLVS